MAGAGRRERSACQGTISGRDTSAGRKMFGHICFLICMRAWKGLISEPLQFTHCFSPCR